MSGFIPYAPRWRPEAQANLRTVASSVSAAAGAFQLDPTTQWQAPTDPFAGTGGANAKPIGAWLSTVNDGVYLAPGYYLASLSQTLVWLADANAPASLAPVLSGARNGSPSATFPKFQTNGGGVPRWGFSNTIQSGAFYVGTGDRITADCFFSDALVGALSSVWSSMRLQIVRLGA